MELVIFALVVCIIALSVILLTKSIESTESLVSRTTKEEKYDNYESKQDRVAWGGFVLFALALIVRFIIGFFKLLVRVARGMGKD